MKTVFKIGEINGKTKRTIEGWLRQHHGRDGWEIKRVTADAESITVHYTDELAAIAFGISPELNRKPVVKKLTFPRPQTAAG